MAVTKKFQIEVIRDRKVTEQLSTFVTGEGGVKQRVVEARERIVPESYMVYFPGGHSIWVESKAELVRMGFTPDENIEIDTDTGLPLVPPATLDLKRRAERKQATGGRF